MCNFEKPPEVHVQATYNHAHSPEAEGTEEEVRALLPTPVAAVGRGCGGGGVGVGRGGAGVHRRYHSLPALPHEINGNAQDVPREF